MDVFILSHQQYIAVGDSGTELGLSVHLFVNCYVYLGLPQNYGSMAVIDSTSVE